MAKKIKNLRLMLFLLAIVFLLVAWLVFDLTINSVKGKVSVVKKIQYQIGRIISPIKPAVNLAVPYHRQEYTLSCEIASLMMALNYKGVKITEKELIEQLPISDPGPRHQNNIWGDPDSGFVGNINGAMPNLRNLRATEDGSHLFEILKDVPQSKGGHGFRDGCGREGECPCQRGKSLRRGGIGDLQALALGLQHPPKAGGKEKESNKNNEDRK